MQAVHTFTSPEIVKAFVQYLLTLFNVWEREEGMETGMMTGWLNKKFGKGI
jgi:hypothetical protein